MLTDADCRNATCPPEKKRHRLTDSGGLYLEVSPSGSKRWFWKFYPDGKESRLALGVYPAVTLKAARQARDTARKLRDEGANPVQQRRAEKLAGSANKAVTFEAVAREFYESKADGWSPTHAARWLRLVDKDATPRMGALPLSDITAPMVLDVLRKVEARGVVETARKLSECIGQVFRYGIATGRCERNPVPDLRGALKPRTVKHMAALLEPAQVGALLRACDVYMGQPVTRAALVLSALLFQRPGNMRAMEWAEIDFDGAMWAIPSAKMKRTVQAKRSGRPHMVPLSRQALAILAELRLLTGGGRYVFPSLRMGNAPMSENTIRAALRNMGYSNNDMTPHGFRATARTLMAERLNMSPDVLEAQLAHGKSGPLGMAYDRAEFMAQRRQMMQAWADYLDTLREGAQVLQFRRA
ncbi:integrase [Vitreoscilla filiformis]|uniref:Integrase n=1 Tax=Vitreoscilla filiformis TaxID=63 RepID=A0A221KBW4_VITFI|nr:integrase arm-type DNA-binding domain-containing protein [Vitreoscilla filiformis]ASM76327.1 integrase [Vitreoscilla filiformis]